MADNIHLIGAEQVSNAGHNMSQAAENMNRAAREIGYVLERQQQFMSQWLIDFKTIMEEKNERI